MDEATQHEREIRAARNQSLFRVLNQRMKELTDTFASLTDGFVIACECADVTCVEMLSIRGEDYEAVRAQPRHFAVLPGHVYPDVEKVVGEGDGYVVVEKDRAAAEMAEILDASP